MSKEAIQKGIDALRGVIAWDIMRNHLVPYRVRDPIHEAIEALAHAKQQEALAEQPAQQDIPDLIAGVLGVSRGTAYDMMREALAEQSAQQTCNCRWVGEVQVQQCTLHESHLLAVHEWAGRAKAAEAKLAEQPAQQEPVADRENAIIRFALHQFMSNAYSHMNAAAQDKDGRRYPLGAAEKFAKDAKDAEALLSRLQSKAPPAQPAPSNMKQSIIEEASIQMTGHPSKDARFFAKSVYEYLMAEQPAQQEPVSFLANGTRFKMSFFENEDGPGTHVTCFEAFEKELDGRWVALVAAEDDCHRNLTSPPTPEPEQQKPLLQEIARLHDRIKDLENDVEFLSQPAQQETVAIDPKDWTPCVKLPVVVHVRQQRPGEKHISTREGLTPVKPDDLIMRGVSGEEYPIGRAIFEQTYSLDTTPPAQRKQVGDSRFESWYSEDFDPKGKGTKQQMREAYEAGMNDPSPQPPAQPLTDEQRQKLRDAFAQSLTGVYVCGRVWEAWQYGTMTEDDFEPASECQEVLDSITEAVEAKLKDTP